MSSEHKDEFVKLLKATLEVYGQSLPSQDVVRIWWSALSNFDVANVRSALDEHIRKSKFAPRPADILEILNSVFYDGRPGADEAWAMMPRDEQSSAVMNQEMADALRIAQPLLDEGDQIAARMAFREAYNRAVEKNKRAGIKPVWFASFGWEAKGREDVVREAVRLGRLPEKQLLAMGFTPEGESNSAVVSGIAKIEKIKSMLKIGKIE